MGTGIVIVAVIGAIALGALVGAILLIRWAWKSNSLGGAQIGAYAGAGCLLLGLVGCPAVMFPVFAQAREAAKRTACVANINIISRAMQMYAADHDERLPLEGWSGALVDYVPDSTVYACPSLESPFGYTFNARMVGKNLIELADPSAVPLLFDGPGGKDSIGDVSLAQYRHLDEVIVGYISKDATRHKQGTIPTN